MKLNINQFDLIAFDADDTLWETQPYFDNIEERYYDILEKYCDRDICSKKFFERECYNMSHLGYGSKAFIISLVENALDITNGKIQSDELTQIINMGRELFEIPATPLSNVPEALSHIRNLIDLNNHSCNLIIFTKGDSKEQEIKIFRSGLLDYFDDYKVYTDKKVLHYLKLLNEYDVAPERFLMIGNSFKSDIDPTLQIGGTAIYIPFYRPWKYEDFEEYTHPNLISIHNISELGDIVV